MEASILTSTKKILGIPNEYEVYDDDIVTHINSTFSIVNQLGVGPEEGFFIEDAGAEWDDLGVPMNQLGVIRTYVFVRVKMLFDPPTVGFMVDATERQISELEWRLSVFREGERYPLPPDQEVTDYDYRNDPVDVGGSG